MRRLAVGVGGLLIRGRAAARKHAILRRSRPLLVTRYLVSLLGKPHRPVGRRRIVVALHRPLWQMTFSGDRRL